MTVRGPSQNDIVRDRASSDSRHLDTVKSRLWIRGKGALALHTLQVADDIGIPLPPDVREAGMRLAFLTEKHAEIESNKGKLVNSRGSKIADQRAADLQVMYDWAIDEKPPKLKRDVVPEIAKQLDDWERMLQAAQLGIIKEAGAFIDLLIESGYYDTIRDVYEEKMAWDSTAPEITNAEIAEHQDFMRMFVQSLNVIVPEYESHLNSTTEKEVKWLRDQLKAGAKTLPSIAELRKTTYSSQQPINIYVGPTAEKQAERERMEYEAASAAAYRSGNPQPEKPKVKSAEEKAELAGAGNAYASRRMDKVEADKAAAAVASGGK